MRRALSPAPTLILMLFGASLAVGTAAAGVNPWTERRVLNMSHRGGRAEAPEHTLYAYETALPKGVNALEIDVHTSADGVLVVHHDATVDRVTNGTGRIDELTLAELQSLDNAYWFSAACMGTCRDRPDDAYPFRGVATGEVDPPEGFAAEDFRIATLEQVLTRFPGILMSIEIKGQAPDSLPTAEATADMLGAFGRVTDVLVASFDDATIAAFKERDPAIHTTPGQDEVTFWVLERTDLPDHVALQIPRTFSGSRLVTPERVERAHSQGLSVYVFIDGDEETEEVYGELIDSGVDGIITDRPTALQVVLEERGVVYLPAAGGLEIALPVLGLLAVARRRRATRSSGPRVPRLGICTLTAGRSPRPSDAPRATTVV